MLAAQPEVLFTYPTPTGDYDKIGRPSLQDGVGRLTCFSPRDDHGKVASVAIQRLRLDRRAAGVTRLGPDGCFLCLCRVVQQLWVFQSHRPPCAHRDGAEWSHALTSWLFSTPCMRACLGATDYAAPPAGVI